MEIYLFTFIEARNATTLIRRRIFFENLIWQIEHPEARENDRSKSDRISIRYRVEHHQEIEHYSWMFKEDLCRNIVPSRYSGKDTVNCQLQPENKDLVKLLYELLPSNYGRHHDDLNEIILVQFNLLPIILFIMDSLYLS